MKHIRFIACIFILSLCACQRGGENSMREEMQAIEALHKKDKAASLKGDVEALLSLFTEDGVVIPAEGEMIRGKQGLRKMLEANSQILREYNLVEYVHDFEEIRVVGDYAWEWGKYRGKYVSKEDGGEIAGGGKIMRILQRQKDGHWKVFRSIWTVDSEEED